MKYTEHNLGPMKCLAFEGDFTMDEALPLRNQKNAMWFNTQADLLIDLAQVAFLDSCAVGFLVDVFHSQRRQNYRFGFCGLQPQAEAVLDLVGLLAHTPQFETRHHALDTWQKKP